MLTLTVLIPASLACLYYLLHIAAGLFPRPTFLPAEPTHRIAILIPAHDEETSLPATLQSLAGLDYPLHLLRVFVVADNCSDSTASIATRAGAECLIRRSPRRGKGYAVEFGLSSILREEPDAVLILDADCTVDPGLLLRFDAELVDGAAAVQCGVVSRANSTGFGYVPAVGADMDNRMAAGAERLGRPVSLRGTGMLFRSDLLWQHPWRVSGVVEDAEYAAVLKRAGVRIRFVPDQCVRCAAPNRTSALLIQRRRWRAALSVPGRNPFVRFLSSKPLVLGQLAMATVVLLLANATLTWLLWLGAIWVLTGVAYLPSLRRVGWPAGGVGTLASAIGLVGRLVLLSMVGFWRKEPEWVRTPREQEGPESDRQTEPRCIPQESAHASAYHGDR